MSVAVPVYGHQEEIRRFVEYGLWEGGREFGPCHCLGFANKSEGLVMGVVYHNYDEHASVVEISAYASRGGWCSASRASLVFDFPFRSWGVRVVIGRHSEKNTVVRGIWNRIGATEHEVPHIWGPKESQIIAVLTAQQWKKSKFNKGGSDGSFNGREIVIGGATSTTTS